MFSFSGIFSKIENIYNFYLIKILLLTIQRDNNIILDVGKMFNDLNAKRMEIKFPMESDTNFTKNR